MACFERASPTLKQILLKVHRDMCNKGKQGFPNRSECSSSLADKRMRTPSRLAISERPLEIDHQMHEFGDVHYHLQSSASDPFFMHLSISMPVLQLLRELPKNTLDLVRGICPKVIEIIEPPREGYQLTLKLDFSRIPKSKASIRMITEISSVRAVILSSQLKEILRNAGLHEGSGGVYRPIKLVYHSREPFFVIKWLEKITAIFPIRFKEETDAIIATSFFQELMDAGNSGACAKAPRCVWSPIPPPELRGESIEDLRTSGGFVSFEITSRHVQGKKLDKTVWNLLNFHAFVNYHVKSIRSFIQRRMRTCLESLVQDVGSEEDQQIAKKKPKSKAVHYAITDINAWGNG